jgi:hypothetical protein
MGNLGALRNLTGNNTWGGTVIAGLPNTVGVDAGGTLNLGRSWFSVGSGTNAGTATATKAGTGVLTVASETFTATRSGGGTSSFQGSVIADSLSIQGGTLRTAPSVGGVKRVSDVNSLTIAAGARLDLTDNALVVDYASGGPSALADVRNHIVTAFAGGAWTGPGITSSMADASNFGLGYGEASGVLTYSGTPADALFLGNVVDQSAVLVRHTRYGDADLNGLVNLSDFNRLAANFGASGAVWTQGDFNYDGLVNLSDFNRLAANFGLSAAGPDVSPEDWSNLAAAIPEPGSLGLAAIAGLGLLKRRRRLAR